MLKKKLLVSTLALALGIGGLSATATLTARAESAERTADSLCSDTRKHFSGDHGYIQATPGDGKIYLEWKTDIKQTANNWNRVIFYLCDSDDYTDVNFPGESATEEEEENAAYIYGMVYEWETEKMPPAYQGSYTLTGYKNAPLENDKTYYLYAMVYVTTEEESATEEFTHDVCYLGVSCTPKAGLPAPADKAPVTAPSTEDSSGTSTTVSHTSAGSTYTAYLNQVDNNIENAQAGSTIVLEKGVASLENHTMKALLEKGNVSLKLEFTYENVDYSILIPAGAALDNDIPIYGPLYLAQHYGNSAASSAAAGESYTVKPGDSLSKIARALGMTLKDLAAKNPQIEDLNKIRAGQKLNLR